jgi:4-hydroxyphenylpyruvate dioxygenase-like putative hemolysin
MKLAIPAIKGIGDSLIYLVDRYPGNAGRHSIYDVDFKPTKVRRRQLQGTLRIDRDRSDPAWSIWRAGKGQDLT